MKLSKRERILLYVLGCFVLLTIGLFFMLLPSMDAKDQAELEYMSAKNRLTQLQNTIAQYGDLDAAITDTNNQISEVRSKFYTPMPNEDVDSLLKTKMLLRNMTPLTLTISDPQEVVLNAFGQTVTEGTNESTQTNTIPVKLINVTMSFTGSLTNLASLIDDINAMEATQVGSLSYNVTNVDEPISISFKLYVL